MPGMPWIVLFALRARGVSTLATATLFAGEHALEKARRLDHVRSIETIEKRAIHEVTRRTRRNSSGVSEGPRPGKATRTPSRSKSDWKEGPPGSANVPPHALPLRAARSPCDGAAGHCAGGKAMGLAEAEFRSRCRSSRVEEMAEAMPGSVRAGRPRSRVDV